MNTYYSWLQSHRSCKLCTLLFLNKHDVMNSFHASAYSLSFLWQQNVALTTLGMVFLTISLPGEIQANNAYDMPGAFFFCWIELLKSIPRGEINGSKSNKFSRLLLHCTRLFPRVLHTASREGGRQTSSNPASTGGWGL